MIDKTKLPKNIEIEKIILGAAINYDSIKYEILSSLNLEDFFLEEHRVIFETICNLAKKNEKVDFYNVSQDLITRKKIDFIGGIEYLHVLIQSLIIKEKIKELIDIVKETSNLRLLLLAMNDIEQEFLNGTNDYTVFVANAQRKINNIAEQRKISNFVSSHEIVKNVGDYIFDLIEKKNLKSLTGLDVGFKGLNDCTNGLQKQNLIVIAGRPGLGKTTLALNLALNTALLNNTAVGIFEMEMSVNQLFISLIAKISRVDRNKILKGDINDDEKIYIKTALNTLDKLKIYVDESSFLTILDLIAKAKRLKQEQPDLGLIIIDYLGLISNTNSKQRENRQLEIQEYTRLLHELARELDLTIILLCQLNRKVEDRGGKPRLSDLRESGSIEQDAEMVWLIYKDEKDIKKRKISEQNHQEGEEQKEETKMFINVAKNRHGKSGQNFSFLFEKEFSSLKFEEEFSSFLKNNNFDDKI